MIERLLIANRGEIAVRIARTAHRMGISTVGVYSDDDHDALHTRRVDVAVRIGGGSPDTSYLDVERILDLAVAHGCDAVHPGYGFLAERADAVDATVGRGLRWVGPTSAQIALLGDKIAAKTAAIEAGVPTTPFVVVTDGATPDAVRFPAIVKAAAGGGGRGMRVVTAAEDLGDAISAASREAASAFGDGTVFIEPFLDGGRHIEVQILGDAHGHVIHLGERDCSVQRRNQKIIEETPAPNLDPDLRDRLCDGAVALARHVGYQSAGTVEYMVGDDGTVSFLEVNTRLQVEHPVTEMVTGIDIVEQQLRIAAGEPLSLRQEDVRARGHAIEARLVAEDPRRGWVPSLGTVAAFSVPDTARVDRGIEAGSTVSVHYDSLLAKVIVHRADRPTAVRALSRDLRRTVVGGVTTNIDALVAILGDPRFADGRHDTRLLDDESLCVTPSVGTSETTSHLAALTEAITADRRAADRITGFAPPGWRNLRTRGERQAWSSLDERFEVEWVRHDDSTTLLVGPWPRPTADGTLEDDNRTEVSIRARRHGDTWSVEVDGVTTQIDVTRHGGDWATHGPTGSRTWTAVPTFAVPEHEQLGAGPVSPLPGTVLEVHVAAGDDVAEGRLLAVVEAMKMEHRIVADRDATIDDVLVGPGDRVDTGTLLVRFADGLDSDDAAATR